MDKDNELNDEELQDIDDGELYQKEKLFSNTVEIPDNNDDLLEFDDNLLDMNKETAESIEEPDENDELLQNVEDSIGNDELIQITEELNENVELSQNIEETDQNSVHLQNTEEYVNNNIKTPENKAGIINNVYDTTVPLNSRTVPTNEDVVENKNNTSIVIFMVVTFIVLIGLCVYIAVSISNDGLGGTKKDTVYQSESDNPWDEILGDDADKKEQDTEESNEGQSEENDSGQNDSKANEASIYDSIDWDKNNWKNKYENHDASEIEGPYYNDFVDCIDTSVDYKINREFEEYYDKEYNVCIRSSYVQIDGDIPNIDDFNKVLKDYAVSPVQYFKDNDKQICEEIKSVNGGYAEQMDFHVTYNDDSIVSIIIQEENVINNSTLSTIYSFNYDVATGTLMDNTKILNLGKNFGEEFRDRSNKQNGYSEYGIEPYSNNDIMSMLNNPSNIILFYTPLGIELGYRYVEQYYSGWVTITMQDYENYLNKM